MRESPWVAVVTDETWTEYKSDVKNMSEPNIVSKKKKTSRQTRSTLRDVGFLFHVFISLTLVQVTWLCFSLASYSIEASIRMVNKYIGISMHMQTYGEAWILWILWAMCRFVLCQPERILTYSSGKITLHGFLLKSLYKPEEMVKSNDKTECEINILCEWNKIS